METKDEVINAMLKRGWLVCIKGSYKFTNKVERDFNAGTQEKTKTVSSKGKDYEAAKERLREFVKKAEIPYRLPLGNGTGETYTVTAISHTGVMIFQKIEANPNIDMEKFISATKQYYQSPGARVKLSNYFEQDVWRGAYEDYLKNGEKKTTTGSSRTNRRML